MTTLSKRPAIIIALLLLLPLACTTAFAQTISLHPSNVAINNGFSVKNGDWSSVLDTNDHDATYAKACCSGPGLYFYVDLDDPWELEDANITSVRINVLTRFLEGEWYEALPTTGIVDIGFKTGATTIWKGNETIDDSGAYIQIQSQSYNTDSDGGPLDFNDIKNMQIAVMRNQGGPQPMRVTEVFAEVSYSETGALAPVLQLLLLSN